LRVPEYGRKTKGYLLVYLLSSPDRWGWVWIFGN